MHSKKEEKEILVTRPAQCHINISSRGIQPDTVVYIHVAAVIDPLILGTDAGLISVVSRSYSVSFWSPKDQWV